MQKLKRYEVDAKNIEYLMTSYVKAKGIEEAKTIFCKRFSDGYIPVNNSEIQFQIIKRKEAKHI